MPENKYYPVEVESRELMANMMALCKVVEKVKQTVLPFGAGNQTPAVDRTEGESHFRAELSRSQENNQQSEHLWKVPGELSDKMIETLSNPLREMEGAGEAAIRRGIAFAKARDHTRYFGVIDITKGGNCAEFANATFNLLRNAALEGGDAVYSFSEKDHEEIAEDLGKATDKKRIAEMVMAGIKSISGRDFASEPALQKELSKEAWTLEGKKAEINLVKRELKKKGHDCGSENGVFDDLTLEKLNEFLAGKGLRGTTTKKVVWGVVREFGKDTEKEWKKLRESNKERLKGDLDIDVTPIIDKHAKRGGWIIHRINWQGNQHCYCVLGGYFEEGSNKDLKVLGEGVLLDPWVDMPQVCLYQHSNWYRSYKKNGFALEYRFGYRQDGLGFSGWSGQARKDRCEYIVKESAGIASKIRSESSAAPQRVKFRRVCYSCGWPVTDKQFITDKKCACGVHWDKYGRIKLQTTKKINLILFRINTFIPTPIFVPACGVMKEGGEIDILLNTPSGTWDKLWIGEERYGNRTNINTNEFKSVLGKDNKWTIPVIAYWNDEVLKEEDAIDFWSKHVEACRPDNQDFDDGCVEEKRYIDKYGIRPRMKAKNRITKLLEDKNRTEQYFQRYKCFCGQDEPTYSQYRKNRKKIEEISSNLLKGLAGAYRDVAQEYQDEDQQRDELSNSADRIEDSIKNVKGTQNSIFVELTSPAPIFEGATVLIRATISGGSGKYKVRYAFSDEEGSDDGKKGKKSQWETVKGTKVDEFYRCTVEKEHQYTTQGTYEVEVEVRDSKIKYNNISIRQAVTVKKKGEDKKGAPKSKSSSGGEEREDVDVKDDVKNDEAEQPVVIEVTSKGESECEQVEQAESAESSPASPPAQSDEGENEEGNSEEDASPAQDSQQEEQPTTAAPRMKSVCPICETKTMHYPDRCQGCKVNNLEYFYLES